MLPAHTLGTQQLRKLKVYAGADASPRGTAAGARAGAPAGGRSAHEPRSRSTRAPAVARRASPASGSSPARARSSSTAAASRSTSATPWTWPTSCMPFRVTGTEGRYNAMVKVEGGGHHGQAGAIRHGIARALLASDPEGRASPLAPGRLPVARPAHEGAQEVRPEAGPQGAAVHQALGPPTPVRRARTRRYPAGTVTDPISDRYKEALRRGHVAVLQGRPREAIAHYEEAGRLAGHRPLPWVSMGSVYLQMRRAARGHRRRSTRRSGARPATCRRCAARPRRSPRPGAATRRPRSRGEPTSSRRWRGPAGGIAAVAAGDARRRRSPQAEAARAGRRGRACRSRPTSRPPSATPTGTCPTPRSTPATGRSRSRPGAIDVHLTMAQLYFATRLDGARRRAGAADRASSSASTPDSAASGADALAATHRAR